MHLVRLLHVNGVKKVSYALHHKIWKHLKRKWCWKIAYSMSLLSLVILYSVWHRVWHRMSLHNYIYFGYCLQIVLEILYFQKLRHFFFILDGCFHPRGLINVLKVHIRWVTTLFRDSKPITFFFIMTITLQWLLVIYPLFAPRAQKFPRGTWFWRKFIPWQNIWLNVSFFVLVKRVDF